MSQEQDSGIQRFKWHIVIICTALMLIFVLTVFTNVFQKSENGILRQMLIMFGGLILLSALLIMLSRVFKIVDALNDNSGKLEEVTSALEKISTNLAQISHSTRVSEAAKAIVFRDADRQSLKQAVFVKLQQRDFEAVYELIDEITQHSEYKDLGMELRLQADQFRDATDIERLNQGIVAIDKLLDECQWVRAGEQIEALIESYPDNDKALSMRHKLLERKNERKKILLAAWDDAVQQQETDRSLEILKELDMYLTPNEGLALQEAAKDIFKTKLHNMGVRFSLAVTEKRGIEALDVGEEIMNDFPNSKMAEEIREKLSVLRQNVQIQSS